MWLQSGAIDNLKKYDYVDDYFYKMLKKQIKEQNRHTINIDLLKYPDPERATASEH